MGNLPIKKYRAGNIQGAIWMNEKKLDGNTVGFKTVSIRKAWKDKEQDIWRDQTINLRKTDIQRLLVVLNKIQEDLLLAEEEKEGEEE